MSRTGQGEYGPYHRFQSADLNEQMEQTGLIGGKPPVNSFIPKVQAHKGPLPPGKTGIEFYTMVEPDPGAAPGWPTWRRGRPGVIDLPPDPKDRVECVAIPARIVKRVDYASH